MKTKIKIFPKVQVKKLNSARALLLEINNHVVVSLITMWS